MNITALSARARILSVLGAAGVSALIGTFALAGLAGATGINASSADVPRLDLSSEVWCYQGDLGSVTFFYDDLADGHIPQQVHEQVADASGVVWTRDDLYQEYGNYFNLQVFSLVGETAPFDRNATLSYSVTMTYDDGVIQTQRTTLDLVPECTGAPPTSTPSTAPTPGPDRFSLTGGYGCGTSGDGAFIGWNYLDIADGHYAARFDIDMLRNSVVVEHHTVDGGDPTSDGALTSFDIRPGVPADQTTDPWFDRLTLEPASYSLSIMVTYEDLATDQHIVTIDLDAVCGGVVNGRTATTVPATTTPTAPGPTTTVPGGTLPETGSGDLTWGIGAVAGLLTTAGAALFAGVRRSRND